jgi:aminopeptidase
MIDPSIYSGLASRVVDVLNVREGQSVFIAGGTHQQAFLEEVAVEVVRRGGQPFVQALWDSYQRRMLETCSEEQLRKTPKLLQVLVEAMDSYIVVEPYDDPSFKASFPDKIKARSEGMQPIMQIIYGDPGKPWVYMGWATEGLARMYGVKLPEMEKLVIGGCNIDYGALRSECGRFMKALEGAKRVHATDRSGTDFWLDVEGRRVNADDGLWSAEKEAAGDTGANLPAGEVFISPVETQGEGTIYCPVTVDDLTRSNILRGVRLYFKDGTLVPEKCTAAENEEVLRETLRKMVDVDMEKYGAPNALKVAELGIGLNPVIDHAIGYILTDEKIGGSVHVAFGMSADYGGRIMSNMHWDFVTAPEITLEVEYIDGSKRTLIKGGKKLV